VQACRLPDGRSDHLLRTILEFNPLEIIDHISGVRIVPPSQKKYSYPGR
jgi:hypothetical protein